MKHCRNKGLYEKWFKRPLDFILSAIALIALSPIIGICAILVRIKLGSPVFFKQARPGLHEKIFYLYKFRSMTNATDEDGKLLPDAQRLTKFGNFLRKSSIDELPELVNIIKGDMSIVGPRPLSIYYLPHYPSNLRRRHEVRPGLTGLAQVNGRNNLPWDDRFEMDIQYVDKVSFGLDVKIVLNTMLKVLKRADVSVRGTTKVKDYGPYSILKEEGDKVAGISEMTYSEIGSYFWMDENENEGIKGEITWLPPVSDSCFAFSGRTAIDIVVRDILKDHQIDTVYAPSYCCVSMLQSFIDRGLKIEFYNISFDDRKFNYELPAVDENSIVLIMGYFGLDSAAAYEAIELVHSKGATVIEDITHSLLRKTPASETSDYLVASLRKWFAIPTGGWIGKRSGKLSEKPSMDSNHAVVEKISGMREKYRYLTGKITEKENFLLTQAKFDTDLIHVNRMLKIDDTSMNILEKIDIEALISKRKKNAEVLIKELKTLDICTLPEVDLSLDTPLFVPILMKTEARNSLRKYMIDRGIYCPVHWPEVMGAPVGIRENELSIICDQRYSERDMQAILDCIKDWKVSQDK